MASTNSYTNSLLTITMDGSGVAVGPAVALTQSPLIAGRKCRLRNPAIATTVSKLQTAPRVDPATGQAPVAGSAAWVDLVNWAAGAAAAVQEVTPDYWVRVNVTTGGGAAAIPIYLEGIQ